MRKLLFGAATVALVSAVAPAAAAPVLWSGNGHYYEFISDGLSFDAALADAASRTHLGLQGYLATITSTAENEFVSGLSGGSSGWGAGSDRETEGTWKWIAGPEAGQIFWNGTSGGSAPPGAFAAWAGGEPNQAGEEDGLQLRWSGSAWNDANTGLGLGYFVEYGGMESAVPEPATWAMMIAGFGLAGGAMRSARRREAIATA